MKPFKWIKKHPFESLLIGAALLGTGGAAAGWFGPAAAAGEAAAGAGAAGAGGASLAGTAAAAELAAPLASGGSLAGWGAGAGAAAAELAAPLASGGSLAGWGGGAESALLSGMDLGSSMAFGEYPTSSLLGDASPSGFSWTGPTAADDSVGNISGNAKPGFKLSGKDALRLASMVNSQQQQGPLGSPQESGNPWQRQAMMTQEQITKKWLLQNDPNTYARIYGSPQPMGA